LIPVIVIGILVALVVVAAVAVFALGVGTQLGVRAPPSGAAPPGPPSVVAPPPSEAAPASPAVKPPLSDDDVLPPHAGGLAPSSAPAPTTLAPSPDPAAAPGDDGLVPSPPTSPATILAPTPGPGVAASHRSLSALIVVVDDLYRHDEVRAALAPALANIAVCFELASVPPTETAEYRWRASVAADGTLTELLPSGTRSASDSLASCMSSQRQLIRLGPTRSHAAGTIVLRFSAQ